MRQGLISGAVVVLLVACHSVKDQLDFNHWVQPVPRHSVLIDTAWYTWGGSMVSGPDGRYYLFYARWSRDTGFRGWLANSEIALATADDPSGPYVFQKTVLTGRGDDFWDATAAHNPHIKHFGHKYYLYYISNHYRDLGMDEWHNRIYTQRIGVAIADHPDGPWERLDQPIIELQPGKAAYGYVVNPSVALGPDGIYYLLFKTRPPGSEKEFGKVFTTTHAMATAPSPAGPFTIAEKPIFTEGTGEDPYLWVQDDRFYALVKDMYGQFTGEKSLALFTSVNGQDWQPASHPLAMPLRLTWEDGTVDSLQHLERPQLWIDADGHRGILFCAASYADPARNRDWNTFNVQIPLQWK
ncbi:MAG: glycoside hydrolase family protein [Saprospiraceae bacterium]